jgi:hypothetical protein
MDGAGTTLPYPTSKLGSGETDEIAQYPQERHLLRCVNAAIFAVDAKVDHSLMVGTVSPGR